MPRVAIVLTLQKGCSHVSGNVEMRQVGILTTLINMAQSSGPQAFLFVRIQKRRMVDIMSSGRGIKTDRAMG